MRTPKKFAGKWRITTMEGFSPDALDLAGPAHMKFTSRPVGLLSFIAVQGEMDCRFEGNRAEFSWAGSDDLGHEDPSSG